MPKKKRRAAIPEAPEPFRSFSRKYPAITSAYDDMGEAVRDAGPLNEREVALVKLALAVGSRLEGATHAHCRRALALGIEPDALRHVAILVSPTLGFPSMMAAYNWIDEIVRQRTRSKR